MGGREEGRHEVREGMQTRDRWERGEGGREGRGGLVWQGERVGGWAGRRQRRREVTESGACACVWIGGEGVEILNINI